MGAPLARRCLGKEMSERYVEETRNLPTHANAVLVRMRPERRADHRLLEGITRVARSAIQLYEAHKCQGSVGVTIGRHKRELGEEAREHPVRVGDDRRL
jgi:hypothetical protein